MSHPCIFEVYGLSLISRHGYIHGYPYPRQACHIYSMSTYSLEKKTWHARICCILLFNKKSKFIKHVQKQLKADQLIFFPSQYFLLRASCARPK